MHLAHASLAGPTVSAVAKTDATLAFTSLFISQDSPAVLGLRRPRSRRLPRIRDSRRRRASSSGRSACPAPDRLRILSHGSSRDRLGAADRRQRKHPACRSSNAVWRSGPRARPQLSIGWGEPGSRWRPSRRWLRLPARSGGGTGGSWRAPRPGRTARRVTADRRAAPNHADVDTGAGARRCWVDDVHVGDPAVIEALAVPNLPGPDASAAGLHRLSEGGPYARRRG